MKIERENRLIVIFVILTCVLIFLIAFVLLGMEWYGDFLKLANGAGANVMGSGGGGAL